MTVYGVHTGLQNTTVAELGTLWGRIEDLGFGWISIWFTLTDARNEPRPVQSELPVWIGGGGEEAHAAHRRPLRRRLERAVRGARDVRRQA